MSHITAVTFSPSTEVILAGAGHLAARLREQVSSKVHIAEKN